MARYYNAKGEERPSGSSDIVRVETGAVTPDAGTYNPDPFKDLYSPNSGGAQDYAGIFKQIASEVPNQTIAQGTWDLAKTFVDRFHSKNGVIPSEADVRQFVASTLDKNFAEKYITGTLNPATISAQYVDPYLQNKKIQDQLEKGLESTSGGDTKSTQDQLEKIYGPLQTEAIRQTREQFAPLRSRAVEEEAALGRLRSGVSAAPGSSIAQTDANEANALSAVIGNILGQKATGTLDLTKFNAGLDLSKLGLLNSASQFNQNLALNKQTYADQQALQNKQLSLSEQIGKLMAKGREPGTLDYFNTAFQGLGALGGLAGAFSGKGK